MLKAMDVLSDAITAGRMGRPKITRTHYSRGWGNRFGPYAGVGFHVVLQGSCWIATADGEPIFLSIGDVVLLPHGTVHGLSDDPNAVVDQLHPAPPMEHVGNVPSSPDCTAGGQVELLCGAYRLDGAQVHPLLRALPDVLYLRARPARHPALRAAVDLISCDVQDAPPGADAALPALLDLVLIYALRAWLEEQRSAADQQGWPAALLDPAIAAALQHMHQHPAKTWTVQTLAEAAGLSRTVFARRFAGLVGRPPLAYLTWWRLSTGARLLRSSDATIAAIAHQVGYTSEFAFANAFRRQFGASPGRYRRGPVEATR